MDFWPIIKRERWLIAGITVFVLSWVTVYCLLGYQPKYKAEATVIVKDSALANRYVLPDAYYTAPTTSSSTANPVLNTMALLHSTPIKTALWEFFQTRYPRELAQRDIETWEDWSSFYKDGSAFIKAKNEPGTDLIHIKFTWRNPTVAHQGLIVLLDAFKAASISLTHVERQALKTYLDGQVAQVEGQLRALREKKSLYKSQMLTVNLPRESDDLAHTRLELAGQLSQIRARIQGQEAEAARTQRLLGLSPEDALAGTAIGLNPTLTKLQEQHYNLLQEFTLLRTTHTNLGLPVRKVQAQLWQVEEDIATELRKTLGKSLRGRTFQSPSLLTIRDATRSSLVNALVNNQLESFRLKAESRILAQRLDTVETAIRTLPETEARLAALEQEERTLSASLDTLRQKELEASLKQAESLSNIFVTVAPERPESAEFPSQLHLLLMGLFLGVACGVVCAVFKAQCVSGGGKSTPASWEPVRPAWELPEPLPQTRPQSSPAWGGGSPPPDTEASRSLVYASRPDRPHPPML